MKYNFKEQLFDKIRGLEFVNPDEYGAKYNRGVREAKARVDSFFNKELEPEVPQYVADWYEENKGNLDYNLWNYIMDWEDIEEDSFKRWVNNSKDAFQTIINMHQFGYNVEKVYLYRVKLIHGGQYLHTETFGDTYFTSEAKSVYSKDKLSNLGFDWVFNCPGIELEEVE
jgi:hypothetical protein